MPCGWSSEASGPRAAAPPGPEPAPRSPGRSEPERGPGPPACGRGPPPGADACAGTAGAPPLSAHTLCPVDSLRVN